MRRVSVNVYKSSINLGSQSVEEFTADLVVALRELYPSAKWFWISEVYGDRVIASIEGENYESSYFEHPYSRSIDGEFTFGAGVEVKRVSTFVKV